MSPSGVEHGLRFFDVFAEVRVLDGRDGDEIDGAAEELFEAFVKVEPGVRVGAWRQWVEFDQEVEVAVLRVEIVAQGGAEQGQPAYMMAAAEVGKLFALLLDFGGYAAPMRYSIAGSASVSIWGRPVLHVTELRKVAKDRIPIPPEGLAHFC